MVFRNRRIFGFLKKKKFEVETPEPLPTEHPPVFRRKKFKAETPEPPNVKTNLPIKPRASPWDEKQTLLDKAAKHTNKTRRMFMEEIHRLEERLEKTEELNKNVNWDEFLR